MSANRITLDTNILVYAIDAREPAKQRQAIEIIEAASRIACPLGLQCIGEFYVAATRKIGLRPTDAQRRVAELLQTFETFPHSQDAMLLASQEAALGRFQFWDAVLLASASQAGCEVCLSEDMQDGARLENIVVRNPFGRNGISVAARTVLG